MKKHFENGVMAALVWVSTPVATLAGVSTNFDEDELIPEISLDIPFDGVAEIELDTDADELTFATFGNTDMWADRRDAPVAWVASPNVPNGAIWAVETQVRYNGFEDAEQRVAGIMFYADEDGIGGSNGGVDFGYGLNDWNNRGVEIQGFGGSQVGDSGQTFINALDDIGNVSSAFLRIEIEENGNSDIYTFFYKQEQQEDWTELASLQSEQDNSRVGLFFKNGDGTFDEDRSVSFTYLIVDDEFEIEDSDEDGISDEYEEANGLDPNDAGDRDLDKDEDGLTNFEEFERRTRADDNDTDDDGLLDGVESDTGMWVSAENTGTDPLQADTDEDGLLDGVETNTGTFVSASDTGTNPLDADTDGDDVSDSREVTAGSDPTDRNSVPSNSIN